MSKTSQAVCLIPFPPWYLEFGRPERPPNVGTSIGGRIFDEKIYFRSKKSAIRFAITNLMICWSFWGPRDVKERPKVMVCARILVVDSIFVFFGKVFGHAKHDVNLHATASRAKS